MKIEIVEALRKRYTGVHPLIFHRSLERARSDVELFDILEGMPKTFPIYWDEAEHCWKNTKDIVQANRFHLRLNKA